MQQQVLGDDLLRRHVRDADQRQHLVRLAGGEQRRRQLQRVGGDDVVVGEAVDRAAAAGSAAAASGSSELSRRTASASTRRVAEVALGVVRVVQPPLGDGAPAMAAWNTSGRRSTASAARKPPKLQPRMRDAVEVERRVARRRARAARRPGRRARRSRGRGARPAPTRCPRPGVPRPSTTTTAKPWSANHCDVR